MDGSFGRSGLSAAIFDPDAIMRVVREKARSYSPATTATLRHFGSVCRNVANVAEGDSAKADADCRNVAIVATRPGFIGDLEFETAVQERAGMAAGRVPTIYLDTWARLNCQKPTGASESEWRLALADGGLLLDCWGEDAAALGWTPGALFDAASGLAWRLGGARVEALGPDHVRLSDGRSFVSGG